GGGRGRTLRPGVRKNDVAPKKNVAPAKAGAQSSDEGTAGPRPSPGRRIVVDLDLFLFLDLRVVILLGALQQRVDAHPDGAGLVLVFAGAFRGGWSSGYTLIHRLRKPILIHAAGDVDN